MSTRTEAPDLDTIAAQVTERYVGCILALVNRRPTLTIGSGVTANRQRAAIKFVAQYFADFTLVTPGDPAPAPATAEWLAEHRRGSHHLADALSNFR